MQKSRILQKLRSGKTTLTTSNSAYTSPRIAEMVGLLDFDALWIDMEHQDYDYNQVFNMALACRATGLDPLVRIRKGDYWSYSRAFEAGAIGIMVPHCKSGEEAKQIARASRFSPLGMRGLDGVEASADYGLAPMAEYMAHANQETFVVVQIEDAEAVEDIDAIAATEGIDVLFIGPADLSQSFGIPLQIDHALMRTAAAACGRSRGSPWQVVGHPCSDRTTGGRILRTRRAFSCFGIGHQHSSPRLYGAAVRL